MSTAVPFLPGYIVNSNKKEQHHKSQKFAISNGVRLVDVTYGADKVTNQTGSSIVFNSMDKVDVDPTAYLDPKDKRALAATQIGSKWGNTTSLASTTSEMQGAFTTIDAQPNWLANDRKVLRFFGFFKESIHSSPLENFRVRKVILYYYLEDDSMHIAEPRTDNSGITQGVLVKRHRIPKSGNSSQNVNELTSTKEYYSPKDLYIGAELPIYGRVFRVIDVDTFTRSYYKDKFDIELPEAEGCPIDPHTRQAQSKTRPHFNKMMSPQKTFMEANLGRAMGIKIDATCKFLENDRKVLRFWATWADPSDGDKHNYVIHYFLADDTVEVKEVLQPNCGRDPAPALLKRSLLPRNYLSSVASVATIGHQNSDDISNGQYYTMNDFGVGKKVNVFGRELLLVSADSYTQDWYVRNCGLSPEDFKPLDVSEPARVWPTMEVPPYNGYGTEEDSLGSFTHLVPKAPRKDFKKLIENDQKNLRFLAKFAQSKADGDAERRFVITWYMADDTLSIFEKADRNSGFVGGKFLERGRVKDSRSQTYLQMSDLNVGSTIAVNHFEFTLLEADEYTLKHLLQATTSDVAKSGL